MENTYNDFVSGMVKSKRWSVECYRNEIDCIHKVIWYDTFDEAIMHFKAMAKEVNTIDVEVTLEKITENDGTYSLIGDFGYVYIIAPNQPLYEIPSYEMEK